MQINFSPDNLKELANLVARLLSINLPEPDWAKLKDVRDGLFNGN
ncbi:hypothetical protein PZE05_09585 [Limosilactobacillus mucosae]|nr:hypothetical protein [Limosilactobacillus mucosae]MDE8678404.1 hypothetical protein [Limosilactobacillus mucosae]